MCLHCRCSFCVLKLDSLLQGPFEDEVEVVHVDQGIPIRVDAHLKLSKYIGFLARSYAPKNRPKEYPATLRKVHDRLMQNFFPGPTWVAATNPRGSHEPLPQFVAVRHEVILCKFFFIFRFCNSCRICNDRVSCCRLLRSRVEYLRRQRWSWEGAPFRPNAELGWQRESVFATKG
jgi:hypothetical protein